MKLEDRGIYKKKIYSLFANNENLIKDLLIKYSDEDDLDEELKNTMFNYQYVPNIQEEAKAYICYDIIPQPTDSKDIVNNSLYIWVYCHKKVMNYNKKGSFGSRADILISDIAEVLDSNKSFGIGGLNFEDMGIVNGLPNDYYGYILVYSVPDFNE